MMRMHSKKHAFTLKRIRVDEAQAHAPITCVWDRMRCNEACSQAVAWTGGATLLPIEQSQLNAKAECSESWR